MVGKSGEDVVKGGTGLGGEGVEMKEGEGKRRVGGTWGRGWEGDREIKVEELRGKKSYRERFEIQEGEEGIRMELYRRDEEGGGGGRVVGDS